jgi:hypothetical protein
LQFHSEADKCINNIAEYEAILLGPWKLRAVGVQTCTLRIDSKVVARQIEKECITREPTLERYLALVRRMECYFKGFTIEYIERTKNAEADVTRIGTRGTTPHRLGRPNERSAMTRPTIHKIPEDSGMLPKA